MRLTLRTLLAYLDGILEPNDAQDIAKKLEDSEYATGLVHRIRDVMRRVRLGAPAVADRNPKHDPNIVAEYLDNNLSTEGVTELEKLCLESDVHLAEVSSCHQILTLVLGEPAEIDPASRQRMYELNAQTAGDASPAPAVSPPSLDHVRSTVEPPARQARPKPTVPEYLRESSDKRRWLPTVAALVLAACFALVVLMALGQFEPGAPLGDLLAQWGLLSPTEQEAQPEVELAAEKPKQPDISEPIVEPAKSSDKPTPTALVEQEGPAPEIADKTSDDTALKEPAAEQPPESNPEIKPEPVDDIHLPIANTENESDDIKPIKADKPAETKPATEQPPLPPEPLGRLASTDQVLLKNEPESGWSRVGPNQVLAQQPLLVLPTYRAKLTLTVGFNLEALGGTKFALLSSSARELPGVRVYYGRIVVTPLAKADSRLRVAFGERLGVLSFDDAESIAALDVHRVLSPGTDPEVEPSLVLAALYAGSGGVAWTEVDDAGKEHSWRLTGGQWMNFEGPATTEPAAAKEMPGWIAAEPISPLDRRASTAIAQAMPTDRLARLSLLELSTSRPQREVKALALRCLSYLGQYGEIVAALNDSARRLEWPDYIDLLRQSVARDAESATAVRMALEKQYPQQAADLYRMLWGYSDKDLQAGEDARLVKALEDETLVVRVLSFWNLKDLTGIGLFYRPEQTAAKRQQPLLRWKQRLEAKEIRAKTPEEKAGAAAAEGDTP